jgi:hypothetical protein
VCCRAWQAEKEALRQRRLQQEAAAAGREAAAKAAGAAARAEEHRKRVEERKARYVSLQSWQWALQESCMMHAACMQHAMLVSVRRSESAWCGLQRHVPLIKQVLAVQCRLGLLFYSDSVVVRHAAVQTKPVLLPCWRVLWSQPLQEAFKAREAELLVKSEAAWKQYQEQRGAHMRPRVTQSHSVLSCCGQILLTPVLRPLLCQMRGQLAEQAGITHHNSRHC